jgi:hypothetical protein
MATSRELQVAAELSRELHLSLDRLPYTEAFDRVHACFVERLGRECTQHQTWWALVGARKRGLIGRSKRLSRA